jgi:PAS domain S-box-containing protein
MDKQDKVNILLVDDQQAKLLSYEVILAELGENLIKANSAREALEHLLRTDIAVVLIDVCMPELDGFELARMIHDHPRFHKTAIIFVSAVQVTDVDRLRGYEIGAVDYVPVPVIPAMLRAKVGVFVDLHRTTRALETLNRQLEQRVEERTAELTAAAARLMQSEQRRTLALAAAQMGSWDWDLVTNHCVLDEGQSRILGLDPGATLTADTLQTMVRPDDREAFKQFVNAAIREGRSSIAEFRIVRPAGEVRWCSAGAVGTVDAEGRPIHVSGVTLDITERKEAEERQVLLAREVDHRSRNALAVVQSILRLSRAERAKDFVAAVDGRIQALATAHTLLSQSRWEGANLMRLVDEEFSPYRTERGVRLEAAGPNVSMRPAAAQAIALALHELVTNAAKYGALSNASGQVSLRWHLSGESLVLHWVERDGPPVEPPTTKGFGMTMIGANVETGLMGRMQLDWRPDGLRCMLIVPRSNLVDGPERSPPPAPPVEPAAPPRQEAPGRGKRILVVEDESLIAMMMEGMLNDIGHSVVGPFGQIEAALEAARNEVIDAAVLDLNLNGTPVYPVADALAERKVPFLLMTGYDADIIEARFAGTPVIQKPIEPAALGPHIEALLEGSAPTTQPSRARAAS